MAFTSLFLTVVFTYKTPLNKDSETKDVIYRFDNKGQTWTDISSGLPFDKAANSISIVDDQIYMSFFEGMIYHTKINSKSIHWEKELFLKTQEISDIQEGIGGAYILSQTYGFYQKVAPTNFWLPLYRSLKDKSVRSFLERSNQDIIISSNQGIYMSKDGGKTWILSNTNLSTPLLYDIEVLGDNIYGSNSSGILKSVDEGKTWKYILRHKEQKLLTLISDKENIYAVKTFTGC